MSKRFSIIIPSYNTSKYIKACITSIKNQTFKDYEIIVVDDCSFDIDLTLNVLNNFSDIKIFFTEKNSGPGAARNLGLSKADGQYIIFLDSDDSLASPKTLETIDSIIGKEFPDIIYTGFQFIGENFCFMPDNTNCTKKFRLAENKYINVWSIVWNYNFIRKNYIKFSEICYSYEDVVFAFKGIALSSSFKIASYVTHNYTRNRQDSSSTRNTNPSKHFNQCRDTVTCIEDLYNLKDIIDIQYYPYLLQRINEQKERLLLRLDRGLKNLLEFEGEKKL